MPVYTDHIGRAVSLPQHPQRIISLCPSITETLFALGLGSRVVGRTMFCIHPQPEIKEIPHVGGTKNVKQERLLQLQPDLVIAEKEENTRECVEALSDHIPVFVIDVKTVEEGLDMIKVLGELTQTQEKATQLLQEIRVAFEELTPLTHAPRVAYLIWQEPFMLAGQDTYIGALLRRLGLQNICEDPASRYPSYSLQALLEAKPELVLLSSEPFPFSASQQASLQEALPFARVGLVDGEMFSWYGSRMLQAVPYFSSLGL
jgi:iron complex transport system substrate-binding protein